MRFYYQAKQIQPNEIKIEMLESQRLVIDRSKDLGVGWPPHIINEIRVTPERIDKILGLIKTGPIWPLYLFYPLIVAIWIFTLWIIWK